MRLKQQGGTARDDEPPLCLTCRHATVIRGRTLRDEIIDCGLLSGRSSRITFPVMSCSGYDDRSSGSVDRETAPSRTCSRRARSER